MKNFLIRAFVLVTLLFIFSAKNHAQYFSVGNDPARLKWEQIKHNDFRLIYPAGSENIARRFYSLLDQGSESIGASLNHLPRRFPMIVHSYSSTSNGYTIWAPRRIEMFPRPPAIGSAESYSDHLLIHEMRHMVQMDKLNVGVTKAFSWIIGEQSTAAVIGLHLPSWFMEGDAVLTETLLSQSGRGRQARFSQGLRSLWIKDQVCYYDKALFGSYKDYTPNYYVMGYHLVSMSRLLGGPSLWSGVLDRIGRRPFEVLLLSRSLKKEIGLNQKELYEKTNQWASNYWKSNRNEPFNPPSLISVNDSINYINYLKPFRLDNGNIVTLKSCLGRIPEFISIDKEGEEKHLLYPGYIESASFFVDGDVLVWAEQNPDIRWENQSFSNIYAFHLESGKKWKISKEKRFFSPSLNSEDSKIVCVEFLPKGETQMVILGIHENDVQQVVKPPENESFHSPIWDSEGSVWVLSTGAKGKSVYRYIPEQQNLELVCKFGWKEVHSLIHLNGNLYFIAPRGSVDAIYKYNISTQELALVSSDFNGINYLTSSGGEIYASVYRTNGYKPGVVRNLDNTIGVDDLQNLDEPYLPLIERAEKEQPLNIETFSGKLDSKRYRKMFHWFKFHSWAPVSVDLSTYNLKPGLMLLSQNDLSTVASTIGMEYDRTHNRFEQFGSISFSGIAPIFDLDIRTYSDQAKLQRTRSDTSKVDVAYRNYTSSLSIQYPLNFSSGRWQRGVIPVIQASYVNYHGSCIEEGLPFWRTYLNIGAGANIYAISRKAHRDIYPRLGYVFNLTTITQTSFFEGNGKTYLVGSIRSYLPGLLVNHSTRAYIGGYLRNDWVLPDQSPILLPRGLYSDFNKYNLSAKLDYSFPFMYPDWNLGSVLYIKRLKANMFLDAAKYMIDEHTFFISTGIDLTSDFFLFRVGAEFDSGVRILYNITENKFGAEFLFNFAVE